MASVLMHQVSDGIGYYSAVVVSGLYAACLGPWLTFHSRSELKFAAFFNSSKSKARISGHKLVLTRYEGVSVLTDVIFAVLPAVLLWRVQLNRRTKIATIPVLSLGFL